ncbi:MAG: hypothetical protein ABW215_18845 [Kibdelosporangium sp.]
MRIRRRVKTARLGDPGLAHRLAALRAVVDLAVRLQPDAEEIIAECCRPGEPLPDLARRGGRIVSEYARLHLLAIDLDADAVPGSLPSRIADLLLHHASTVEGCLRLAFSQFWDPAEPRTGHRHTGLGADPARALRDSRTLLTMWLAELSRTPA